MTEQHVPICRHEVAIVPEGVRRSGDLLPVLEDPFTDPLGVDTVGQDKRNQYENGNEGGQISQAPVDSRTDPTIVPKGSPVSTLAVGSIQASRRLAHFAHQIEPATRPEGGRSRSERAAETQRAFRIV